MNNKMPQASPIVRFAVLWPVHFFHKKAAIYKNFCIFAMSFRHTM